MENRMKNQNEKKKKKKMKRLSRLSFITQFKIEFLLPFTGHRKVLKKCLPSSIKINRHLPKKTTTNHMKYIKQQNY